jgi:hypothetical protein
MKQGEISQTYLPFFGKEFLSIDNSYYKVKVSPGAYCFLYLSSMA